MPWKDREAHREQIRAISRRFHENHKEKRNAESREYGRTYRNENRDKYRKLQRDFYYRQPNAFRTWKAIHSRCYNPNVKSYEYYGAKGIKVVWQSFEEFLKDMGDRPFGWDLHRKDNSKNYCKENCVWLPKDKHSRVTKGKLTTEEAMKND